MAVSEDDLTARLRKVLYDHNVTLEALDITTVVAKRLPASYQEIRARLVGRGFTAAQVDLWARLDEYWLDIATYWSLVDFGQMKDEDREDWVEVYDRREELDDAILLDSAGTKLEPSSAGALVFGITNLEDANIDLGIRN